MTLESPTLGAPSAREYRRGVGDSFDSIMRAEIASLRDQVAELAHRFEEARTYGDPAEVHRLRPLLDEASERRRDAEEMPALGKAATALHYSEGEGWHGLDRCQDALEQLLYHHGGDGMSFLEVVEATPTQMTLVGDTYWVIPPPTPGKLVEATFFLDQSGAISRIVVRAGEAVSDGAYNRPESDAQWAVVIRAPTP